MNDTNTTNNTTTADSSQDGTGSSKSSSSESSSSVDVEEQELSYTRDQPTKTVNGVKYNLIYGSDNKPSYWESSDGQSKVLPLKKNSGSSGSASSASSLD